MTPVHSRCCFLAGGGYAPDPTCSIMATFLQPATCICPHIVHRFSSRTSLISLSQAHGKEFKYQLTHRYWAHYLFFILFYICLYYLYYIFLYYFIYFKQISPPSPPFLLLLIITKNQLLCLMLFRILSLWRKAMCTFYNGLELTY